MNEKLELIDRIENDIDSSIAILRLLLDEGGLFSYTKDGMLHKIGKDAFIDRYDTVVSALSCVEGRLQAVIKAIDN